MRLPDPNKLPIVEIKQAFRWECPSCRTENFDRAETVELDPEEEREVKEQLGIEPYQEGAIVSAPETVTCRECLKMYLTFDRRGQGDRDDGSEES